MSTPSGRFHANSAPAHLRLRLAALARAVVGTTMATALLVALGGEGFAQPVQENVWATNGDVRTVVRDGGTIYIGGNFTHVGPVTGSGAPLDLETGALPESFPKVLGKVYTVASDGAGGWYIGGIFTAVGGVPRSNIAHVTEDLLVSAWDPNPDYFVVAIAVSGSTVYVGGFFKNIGGSARRYLAAIDATTGAATAWNPDPNDPILALAVGDSTIYAGGYFTFIGGQTRIGIAALDAASGAATAWNLNVGGSFPRVSTLAVSDTTIYAGGPFTSIGGRSRNRIAKLSSAGGVYNWNPNADGEVGAIVVSGSRVYVGGNFRSIGGQARNYIAALDATTGRATGWNPNARAVDEVGVAVSALAVSGSTVYVGGNFSEIGGQARRHLAAIDASTGAATPWNPNANQRVLAMAVSGSRVFAGGWFTTVGGQARNYIAALNATTGVATDWDPNANGYVYDLAVNGSTVYACGRFESIGGQARHRIAALDGTTGLATSWNPSPNVPEEVWTMTLTGSTIYVGGTFNSIGGKPRNHIAALDATTGLATEWNPNADNVVQTIVVRGSTIYAGGWFTSIGGEPRNMIAALDVTTGAATSWNPNVSATGLEFDPQVSAMAVRGSTVYVGGYFSRIGGQARTHIAALDMMTGTATAWNPGAGVSGPTGVTAVAVTDSTIYAGGAFTRIGGHRRNYIAGIDLSTGEATPWDPNASWLVEDLTVSGSTVYVGGRFWSLGGMPASGLAAIEDATLRKAPTGPAVAGLQCSPNPFRTSTDISFTLPSKARVTLEVFDVAGRLVATPLRDELMEAGTHHHVFRHPGLPSGLYLSRLKTDRDVLTGRMLLVQ